MLAKKHRRVTDKDRQVTGFTIVEVLIVLAIAGLIIALIFGVIPTLLRNSQNNQRKQDVAAILDAVAHYQLNNSGAFPDCGYGSPPIPASCIGSGNPLQYAKLTFYTSDPQVIIKSLASSGPSSLPIAGSNPNSDGEKVYIYNYQKCDPNTPGTSSGTGADYRDIVALYAIETGNATTGSQCHQF